jgi:hypothetical protein
LSELSDIVAAAFSLCNEQRERINVLEAKLAACEWKPITETDLPKVGDEVGGTYFPNLKRPSTGWHVCDWSQMMQPVSYVEYQRLGWTHFRAINPPQQEAKR